MSIIEKAMLQRKTVETKDLAQEPPPSAPAALASASAVKARPGVDSRSSPFGTVDLSRLKQDGMADAERSRLAEELRIIKRSLLAGAFSRGSAPIKNGNLIMVTSALPGEGKTFSAVNLAMSIADERDHTVLLVDADMAKPREAGFLGLPQGKGLLDLLLDEHLQVHDVLVRTNIPKLNVLLSGFAHPHATELLASERMQRLVTELAQRYHDRVIIFDSPPLLMTTEACALAARMGQVLLVVEAGVTTQAVVREALSQLEKCNVFGLLNKTDAALGEAFAYGKYGDYVKAGGRPTAN
jgi:receptor protein-tyrosine kinase